MHHTWSGAEAAVSGAWVTKLRRARLRLLVVIDGAKALRKAVTDTFGERALIHRCHQHKNRNVTDALPERMRATVRGAMNQAYATRDPSAPAGCSSIWRAAWSPRIRARRPPCARGWRKLLPRPSTIDSTTSGVSAANRSRRLI